MYLNQRINTDSNILITFFLNNFLNFFFNIVTIVISFSILYSINTTLAIILVFLIPFYILSYKLLKNRLYRLSLKNKETQDRFFSDLTEQITNIKSIKINSSFELYKTKAEKSFKYDNYRYILNDFNYTFKLGKIYCIKGGNGTGKSTLLNILIGLISEYDAGKIQFNGINIKQLDMYKIRKELLSVVLQDYILKDIELKNIIYRIKNNKLIILISHDNSIIDICDEVIELN